MASLIVQDQYHETLAETDACMRCGQPAVVLKYRRFSWCPQWVYLLLLVGLIPCAIVALILTKRKKLNIPLCEAHKNHWLWRQLVVVGGFLAFIALGFAAMVLMGSQQGGRRGDDVAGFICLGAAGLGLVWLITAVIVQQTAIRPTKITDRAITLTNVSKEFVQAFLRPGDDNVAEVADEAGERWAGGRPRRGAPSDRIQGRQDDIVDLPPDAIQEGR
jgi:hypothetical protein